MQHGPQTPSAWVLRWAPLLPPGARVLDLACGHGRHARYLAARGALVTALDRDEAALALLRKVAGINILAVDIESAPWPFVAGAFDAIVVTNYLHRPLFPQLAAALTPGGVLIYETFMAGNERYGRPSNPQFLLRPGELLSAVQGLRVVAFEEGFEADPPRFVQRIAAVREHAAAALPARYRLSG